MNTKPDILDTFEIGREEFRLYLIQQIERKFRQLKTNLIIDFTALHVKLDYEFLVQAREADRRSMV